MDKTGVHQKTKLWVEAGGSAPKTAKSIASAKKIIDSVFWDTKGILLIDRSKTITGECYSNLLDQLDSKIRKKKPGLKKK